MTSVIALLLLPVLLASSNRHRRCHEISPAILEELMTTGSETENNMENRINLPLNVVGRSYDHQDFLGTGFKHERNVDSLWEHKRDTEPPFVISGDNLWNDKIDEERATKDTPWSCVGKIVHEDLGPEHYPRFVRHILCENRVCIYGYRCKPVMYQMQVLKRKTEYCKQLSNQRLSATFESHWEIKDLNVSVCCHCAI